MLPNALHKANRLVVVALYISSNQNKSNMFEFPLLLFSVWYNIGNFSSLSQSSRLHLSIPFAIYSSLFVHNILESLCIPSIHFCLGRRSNDFLLFRIRLTTSWINYSCILQTCPAKLIFLLFIAVTISSLIKFRSSRLVLSYVSALRSKVKFVHK